mmetsp:Transcript_57030/g.114394  ORF Transcript_57030/g.114394 Transcript_57030/m.114394 type:complete len:260 (-) Transcript_57030:239-1018(-)
MLCFGVLVLDLLHEVVSRDMTGGSRRVRHLRPAVALVCYQGDCFALGQTDLPRFCGLKIETHDEQASLRVKYFVVAVVVTTPLWSHRLLLSWSHEEVQRRHPPPGPVCRHHLRPAVAVVDKHAHGFTLNQADLPVFACFELKRGDQRNAFAFPLLRVIILAILLVIVFVALVDGLHSHFHRVVVIVLLLTTTSAAAAVAIAAAAAVALFSAVLATRSSQRLTNHLHVHQHGASFSCFPLLVHEPKRAAAAFLAAFFVVE